DEGSGYLIGLEGLRAVLRGVDGRGPKTTLEPRLLNHLGITEPRGILQFVYGSKGTKAEIASLSRHVIEEDLNGDQAAGKILDNQADLLVETVVPVYRNLF